MTGPELVGRHWRLGEDGTAEPTVRRWYLIFQDTDGNLEGLFGPVVGGEAGAVSLMNRLLERDADLVQAWDTTDVEWVASPYWFHTIKVVDLTRAELEALTSGTG